MIAGYAGLRRSCALAGLSFRGDAQPGQKLAADSGPPWQETEKPKPYMAYSRKREQPQHPFGMPRRVSLLTALVVCAWLAPACGAQAADDFALPPTLLQIVPWIWGLMLLAAPVAWVRRLKRRSLLGSQNTLQSLWELSGRDFQRLVRDGFRRQGYVVEMPSAAARAGGIDVVLTKSGRKILVQCRHGDRPQIGLNAVEPLAALMGAEGATGVLIVTSGAIGDEARAFAADKPIALIEGPTLLELVTRSRAAGSHRSGAPARREPYLSASIADLRECPLCDGRMIAAPQTATLSDEPGQWVCPSTRCTGARAA